jgi:hypothetical protein
VRLHNVDGVTVVGRVKRDEVVEHRRAGVVVILAADSVAWSHVRGPITTRLWSSVVRRGSFG